jgi:hypothetical protein
MNAIRRCAAEDAHVFFGTAYDETLGDQLRVTVMATDLNSSRRAVATPVCGRRVRTDSGRPMRDPLHPLTIPSGPADDRMARHNAALTDHCPVTSGSWLPGLKRCPKAKAIARNARLCQTRQEKGH